MLAAKRGVCKTIYSIEKEGCGRIKGGSKLLESVFIRRRVNKNLLLLGHKGWVFALVFLYFRYTSASSSLMIQKICNLFLTITESDWNGLFHIYFLG
jgi:hypothetical protein